MLYKFCSPNQHSLSNLAKSILFCRHFEDFNDPFEFWTQIYSGMPKLDNNDIRYQTIISAFGYPGLNIEDLSSTDIDRETLLEYFDDIENNEPLFSKIFDNVRISCFSSDITNLLMWSHYADGLRGFCIEFDEDYLFTEDEHTFLVPVRYANSPSVIDAFYYSLIEDQYNFAVEHGYEEHDGENIRNKLNDIMNIALASKPVEWQYEKEKRLIVNDLSNNKEPVMYNYNKSSIKSIILGEKIGEGYKTKIFDILNKKKLSIPIKTATRSKDCYSIKIK